MKAPAGAGVVMLLLCAASAWAAAAEAQQDHASDRGHPVHDSAIHSFLLVDQLEASQDHGSKQLAWAVDGWMGTDIDRLWLRSEGEREAGRTQSAHLGVLYGRSFAAWWDVLAGLRQDFRPGSARTFATLGIQGLAPQWFEVSALIHAGGHGQALLELEASYELLLTNQLILQPTFEALAWRRSDAARATGSGLATAEAGLRLRYEITRRFAPYAGVSRERSLGATADLRRAAAQPVAETRYVFGLRMWF